MPAINKTNKKIPDSLTNQEKQAFVNDLKRFGFLLPTNDEELEEFEKIFGTTKIMMPGHLKNQDFPSSGKNFTNKKLKPVKDDNFSKGPSKKVAKAPIKTITANAYFKKLVLAAEIVTQLHKEYFFGHIKFVKIQFLCDQICSMDLSTNYGKYAAGPFDPKLMHSIDREFIKRKWFKVTKTRYGFRYSPDINADDYKKYYSRYFIDVSHVIDHIINLFRKKDSDFCEIVATLFAKWKEKLEKQESIDDEILIKDFYEWSEGKKRFPEKNIIYALNWMRGEKIVPSR